jgi:hypothetical protein
VALSLPAQTVNSFGSAVKKFLSDCKATVNTFVYS